jgi:probable phosphoglycerate mutase
VSAALQLYLIRHGETAWSITGQHTGLTDIALTAHGEEEARALASYLRTVHFTRILTSPLRRARQTCELAGFGDAQEIDPDLVEWNYGDYEGKRTVDIQAGRPGWNVWRDGCPGGETPGDIADRADRLISRLRELSGPVALFSHGQFGAALAVRWIGLSVLEAQHFALSPASISVLAHEAGHPKVPVIALWNACADDNVRQRTDAARSPSHDGPSKASGQRPE